jgi:kinesin family member 2/24
LDEVYGPEKSSQDIYEDKVQQLVKWVWDGGMSVLLAYGQTGSGKTFTVTALESLVVERLMDGKLGGKKDVHMCIFEVFGNNLYGKFS